MSKTHTFTPSKTHLLGKGYPERVTKKDLQWLLLNSPTIVVKGHVLPWEWRHVGVGVYEIWVKI